MALKNPFNKKAREAEPEKAPVASAPEPVSAAPPPRLTDEGVPYAAIDTTTIVTRATDAYDARRRELHIKGRAFAHVSEAADGAWIYRHDT